MLFLRGNCSCHATHDGTASTGGTTAVKPGALGQQDCNHVLFQLC
jgi:hypothetical protein